MTLYPGIQRKAQEELDRVIGSDRLPTFADRDRLPYISALVMEVLRWIPIGPLGMSFTKLFHSQPQECLCFTPRVAVPHLSTQDDWYNGYFIPKGTNVIPNIWYVLQRLCVHA